MAKMPIAVLIDGENVASSHIAAIMKKAESIGEPVTGCVVGDFSANRLGEWARAAPRHALELVYQPSCGKGMNSADIALTIRAMDLLASGAFRGFLLVSSDRDFAPLALRLRRAGVAVYGMGEAKAGGAWRNACTQFFDLVAIPTGTPATATGAKPATIEKQAAPPNTAWNQQDREAVRGILRSRLAMEHPGSSCRNSANPCATSRRNSAHAWETENSSRTCGRTPRSKYAGKARESWCG